MFEPPDRERGLPIQSSWLDAAHCLGRVFVTRPMEAAHVIMRHARPDHFAADEVCAFADAVAHGLVAEEIPAACPIAEASPKGTRIPRPSASNSSACQYGVEMTAFGAETARQRAARDLRLVEYGVI